MKPFSLLIKPASADCTLRCAYCFYLDHARLYPESSRHRMAPAVLDRLVSSYMATDQPQYSFGWQGGEPTLMGLEFFERVVELQQRRGRPGAVVGNGLQTNALLIDEPFARHLARYRFLLGVSLDGPADVHDAWRRTPDGRGTHAAVLERIALLRANAVEFNILTLVTPANVRRGPEVYRYLRDAGFLFHQYIPCVEFDPAGAALPWTISGPEWGEFLCGIFDEWRREDVRKVSVRLFDSILALLVDKVPNVCPMGTDCRQYFVVEYNGDVYPCDFFVEAGLKLGNIMGQSWEELQASEAYRDFGTRKSRWNAACAACPHLRFCRGDCLKYRLRGGGGPETLSWLCEGWKRFHAHSAPFFRDLAEKVVAERRAAAEAEAARLRARSGPPGRNEPCPCGSGRKYKKCCGR